MVVGMPHQQQQKVASPAAAPLDAFIPGCGLSSPPSTTATSCNDRSRQQQTSTIINIASDQATAKCSSSSSSSSGSYKEADKSNAIAKCSSLPCDLSDAKNSKLDSRVKLTDVNPHLVCVLCHGYFVDATSIAECLHSFCRSCIILYLETKNYCPICEVHINSSRPHLSLKPDKTLQDIVYKLVPKLFHSEMKRRQEFYENCPNRDLHLHPESRGITVDRLVYSPDDYICFSLEYYDNNREEDEWRIVGTYRVLDNTNSPSKSKNDRSSADENDNKKFLVCPASVRIAHLKKLIKLKYDLRSQKMIEVFYRRESLPDDYSLMDIAYIYTWKRNSPMRFYYRINLPHISSSDQYYFAVAEKEAEKTLSAAATQPSTSSQTMVAAEEEQTVDSSQCAPANAAVNVNDSTPVVSETRLGKETTSQICDSAESENSQEDRLATDKSDVSDRSNNENGNSDDYAAKEKSAKVSSEDDAKQVNHDNGADVVNSDVAGAGPGPTEKCATENSEKRSNDGDYVEQSSKLKDEGKKESGARSEDAVNSAASSSVDAAAASSAASSSADDAAANSAASSSADDATAIEAASGAGSTLAANNSTRQPAETGATPSAGKRKHEKNNKSTQSSELKRLLVTKAEKPPVPNLKALVRQPAAAIAVSVADKKKSPALLKSYLSVSSILSSQRSSPATLTKSNSDNCAGPAANNETATNSAATNGNDDAKAPPKSTSPTCYISGVCSSPSFCGGMISLSTSACTSSSSSSSSSSSCSNSIQSSTTATELTVTKSDSNNSSSTKWSSPIINLKQFVTSQPSVARPEAIKNPSKKLGRGGKRSAPPLPSCKDPAKKLATCGAAPSVQNIRKLSTYLVSSANRSVCSNGNNDVSIVEKRSSSVADVSKKKGPVSSVPPIISPEVFITVNPSVACEKANNAVNKASHQTDVAGHFNPAASGGAALNHVVVSSSASANTTSGPFKLQQSAPSSDKQAKTAAPQNSRISNVSFPIIRNSATPISRFAPKSSSGDSSQPSRKRPSSPIGSSPSAEKKMRTTCVPSTSIVKKFAGISGDVYNLAKEVEITVSDCKGSASAGDKMVSGSREDGQRQNSGNEVTGATTCGTKEASRKPFSSNEHRLIIRNSQVVTVAQQQQQQQQQAALKKVSVNQSGRELGSRAVPGLIEINVPAYNSRFGGAVSSQFSSSLTGKKSVLTASNNVLDLSSPSSSSAAKSPSATTSPSAASKADAAVSGIPVGNKAGSAMTAASSNGRAVEQSKTSPKLTPPRALPLMVSPPFRSSSPMNQKPPAYPSSPIKRNPSPTANGSSAAGKSQSALTDFYNSSSLALKQNFEIQKMLAFQQQHGLNAYSINGVNAIKDTKLDDLFLRYMYAAQVGTLPPHPLMFSPRPTKTPSPSFDSCTTSSASPSGKRQK